MIPSIEGPALAIQGIVALIALLVLVALATRDPRRREVAMEILRLFLRSKSPNESQSGDKQKIFLEQTETSIQSTLPEPEGTAGSHDQGDAHDPSSGSEINRNS